MYVVQFKIYGYQQEQRGVGLGWVSILSNEILKETLGLPEHVVPVAYLCLGYVNEFADKPDLETAKWLPRLDLKDVVYYEKWEDKENLRLERNSRFNSN